jgi:hypothetical protein
VIQQTQNLNSPTTFGFISIREIEGVGHCGGLLIVSQIGRPIEFHCSAPVTSNRAQEILYGQTYETFLYCEQIGLALVRKTKTNPQLYIANCAPLLSLNGLIDAPTVVLADRQNTEFFSHPREFENKLRPQSNSIELGHQRIWLANRHGDDGQMETYVRKLLQSFTNSLPLDEPFERIDKAIDEAQAVAR